MAAAVRVCHDPPSHILKIIGYGISTACRDDLDHTFQTHQARGSNSQYYGQGERRRMAAAVYVCHDPP